MKVKGKKDVQGGTRPETLEKRSLSANLFVVFGF